ncbi:MAG: hypothetical protein LBD81_01080, partial [Holosporaceae bacterium]|nr:hypothetical protein [Holosporaceae bacterium]
MPTLVEIEEQKSSLRNATSLQRHLEISANSSSFDRNKRVSSGDLSNTLLKDCEISPIFYSYLTCSTFTELLTTETHKISALDIVSTMKATKDSTAITNN